MLKDLKKEIQDLTGNINVVKKDNMLILAGEVTTSVSDKDFNNTLTKVVNKHYPKLLFSNAVKIKKDFTVFNVDTIETTKKTKEKQLDEVSILYTGMFPVDQIVDNEKYKGKHIKNFEKLDNCVRVLDFISPLVLDCSLKIIDGSRRLELAKHNGIKEVPVVIINTNDKRADFLRLALNRSSEFQRWEYREVDDFIDDTPQIQPIAEPLGFFGKNVLPESYFVNSVVNYIIDPFNSKQQRYSQEIGLAEWAEIRRKEMGEASRKKREQNSKKQKKKANAVSLFNLNPKKEDFLDTYNVEDEMLAMSDKWREKAEKISDISDEISKENGTYEQKVQKSPREIANERRLEAISTIHSSDLFTNEEKVKILSDLDTYMKYLEDLEELKRMIK